MDNQSIELALNQILQQAPTKCSEDDVRKAFQECDQDIVRTLNMLWGEKEEPVKQTKSEWEERRELCNTFNNATQSRFRPKGI